MDNAHQVIIIPNAKNTLTVSLAMNENGQTARYSGNSVANLVLLLRILESKLKLLQLNGVPLEDARASKTLMRNVLNTSTEKLVITANGLMVKFSGKNVATLASKLSKFKLEVFHLNDVMELKIPTLNAQNMSVKNPVTDVNG
jgi:hypothetical protein